MKRLIALLLAAMMVLGAGSALAEKWTCPECGKLGNTGWNCPNCGAAKPTDNISPGDTGTSSGSTDIRVGDYVYFGRYEQDSNTDNGQERIRWLVIGVDGDKLFLLSEKGLERGYFHVKSDGTRWSGCKMREWLNGEFLNTAFTWSEAAAIQTTEVRDTAETSYKKWNTANRLSGTTKDKVFLLSYQEVTTLVGVNERLCEPTRYLKDRGIARENYKGRIRCWYWLRTSAFRNNAGVVDQKGNLETCYIHNQYGCIRPALWVEASAVSK